MKAKIFFIAALWWILQLDESKSIIFARKSSQVETPRPIIFSFSVLCLNFDSFSVYFKRIDFYECL